MTVVVIWSYMNKIGIKNIDREQKTRGSQHHKMSFECPWETWKNIPEDYLRKAVLKNIDDHTEY